MENKLYDCHICMIYYILRHTINKNKHDPSMLRYVFFSQSCLGRMYICISISNTFQIARDSLVIWQLILACRCSSTLLSKPPGGEQLNYSDSTHQLWAPNIPTSWRHSTTFNQPIFSSYIKINIVHALASSNIENPILVSEVRYSLPKTTFDIFALISRAKKKIVLLNIKNDDKRQHRRFDC